MFMKRILASLALIAIPAVAWAAAPQDPSGTYLTQDGKARIRVEKCGPQNANLCGFAVWLKTPLNDQGKPRVDFRNPDAKKQARPSLGHQMIMGLKVNDDARYEGKIYNAEDGKYYDVTIWTDKPGELTVRGCLIAFLCQSQTWELKSDTVQGQLVGPTNGANGPRADVEWAPKVASPTAPSPATTGTTANATGPSKPAAKAAPAQKSAAPKPTETAE